MKFVNNIMYSPLEYADAAVVAQEAAEEMFSRLDWMTIKPTIIVDMGCGTGEMSARLQTRYKDATVLALDMSEKMTQYAKQSRLSCLCADASRLPFPDRVVDLIFANFLLPWCPDFSLLLREWRRVLRPNGLLMFTALGPDTLQEGKNILHAHDLPQLIDIHDMGDLLLQEKFADPVLDVNHYTLIYRDKEKLVSELYHSGIVATVSTMDNMPAANGTWPITYEVIYAHAFVPADKDEISASADGMVRVPLSHLRQRMRSKE